VCIVQHLDELLVALVAGGEYLEELLGMCAGAKLVYAR